MDTTSNWAKQWCIFRNSSLSCWILFLFFSPIEKAAQFQVPQKQYCRCLPVVAGRGLWCLCSLLCSLCSTLGSMLPALQPWSMLCSTCSTLGLRVAAPLQPPVSLGPGCSSPCCRPRWAGELSSEHTLSLFHPGEPWRTLLWSFVLGRVQSLQCAQKCWDALSGAFSLSSNHSESCGELGWGSDIRPLNLQYVGVSAVVVTYLAMSFLVLITSPVLVSSQMLAQVLFFRNSLLKILKHLVNSLTILETLF